MNKAIKKIELDLDGKVISLTPIQAEHLKDVLDELFGVTVVWKEEVPFPVPTTYPPRWEWYWPGTPYYTASGGTTCAYNGANETLRLTG